MRRNADRYAEIRLEIGAPVFHRLMRRCTDPVNLRPCPHLKHAAEAYKMKEGEARELFDRVFCTQIPRVLHEHFCLPRYNGFDDETLSYEEAHGLCPRERQQAFQVGEAREEVEARYDTDIERFLNASRPKVKTLQTNQMDQFVA